MKTLTIVGAGGHGRVVAEVAELLNYQISFIDDRAASLNVSADFPIVSNLEQFLKDDSNAKSCIFVAVGDNRLRANILAKFSGFEIVSLRHPDAIVSRRAIIGTGTVIVGGAVINSLASIGSGVIINTAATIDHDCIVGDFVHISPGALIAGGVTIGDFSWVGIGASVIEGVRIGRNVVIGAGAAVVSDVADDSLMVGVPARAVLR